jgi:hypothetical protein
VDRSLHWDLRISISNWSSSIFWSFSESSSSITDSFDSLRVSISFVNASIWVAYLAISFYFAVNCLFSWSMLAKCSYIDDLSLSISRFFSSIYVDMKSFSDATELERVLIVSFNCKNSDSLALIEASWDYFKASICSLRPDIYFSWELLLSYCWDYKRLTLSFNWDICYSLAEMSEFNCLMWASYLAFNLWSSYCAWSWFSWI